MENKRFLDYIYIENAPGGNQDWLPEWDMHVGGCAAVTACDVCIYLAKLKLFSAGKNIYPFNTENLNRQDFIKFASIMKPYLTPRYHGIDFLEIYISGLSDYWRDSNYHELKIEGLSGNADFEISKETLINQIDNNLPVPFLLLNHKDLKFDDLEWHWFNLTGYEFKNHNFFVRVVTYGETYMVNFRELWDTGRERKGGIIRIFNTL